MPHGIDTPKMKSPRMKAHETKALFIMVVLIFYSSLRVHCAKIFILTYVLIARPTYFILNYVFIARHILKLI